jgi:hypothetical protein
MSTFFGLFALVLFIGTFTLRFLPNPDLSSIRHIEMIGWISLAIQYLATKIDKIDKKGK